MNITEYYLLRQAALLVTTSNCFDVYFMDFNFFDKACFLASLSKCLGLGVVLGSILVKLPQIIKIIRNKSGVGISLVSVTLDLTAITIYSAYSYRKQFPFSAWGDALFMAIQTIVVGVLVLFYGGSVGKALLYLIAYLTVNAILLTELTPLSFLWSLQGFNIFIVISGKLVQAYSNYKNGHTGQLSAITLWLLFLGAAARIFTSIQETGDSIVILTYIASTFANGILVAQLLWYWNVQSEHVIKEKIQ